MHNWIACRQTQPKRGKKDGDDDRGSAQVVWKSKAQPPVLSRGPPLHPWCSLSALLVCMQQAHTGCTRPRCNVCSGSHRATCTFFVMAAGWGGDFGTVSLFFPHGDTWVTCLAECPMSARQMLTLELVPSPKCTSWSPSFAKRGPFYLLQTFFTFNLLLSFH